MNKLPQLIIGNLEIYPPFILGGMGVRITNHDLVSAVANCGMGGTIASVGLCARDTQKDQYIQASNLALIKEIRESRKISKGIIGVNIMQALTNYEDLVKTSVSENVDYIISGAGIPLNLPEFLSGPKPYLIPIVSSPQIANIICAKWLKRYNRLPDAFIVEGALAGGHLGYNLDQINKWTEDNLQSICKEVLSVCQHYEDISHKHIPVIGAGGIFDGNDIAKYLLNGLDGVQMATRFITTTECSVPNNFKQKIIDSKKEDMVIIKSPVGLPGRAIRNNFVDKILNNEKFSFNCPYHCLKTCNPNTSPFCIADALVTAHEGDVENGLIMAGYNAYRINEILPVNKLVNLLFDGTLSAIYKSNNK